MRLSEKLYEFLIKAILLISSAMYACIAAYMTSVICFSLIRLSLDIPYRTIVQSVCTCIGIGFFTMNSKCLQIASATSDRSASEITSFENTERFTSLELHNLYESRYRFVRHISEEVYALHKSGYFDVFRISSISIRENTQ